MAYHEVRLPQTLSRCLWIEGKDYDIDYLGQDDGRSPDPDASFRLLFQLGRGYMIYLYVVGMARPDDPRSFHSFWQKDCAVAEVDVEEWGPPRDVACEPIALPVVFRRVEVTGPVGVTSAVVTGLTFESMPRPEREVPEHVVRFALCAREGEAESEGELTYRSVGGWRLRLGDRVSMLDARHHLAFSEPAPR